MALHTVLEGLLCAILSVNDGGGLEETYRSQLLPSPLLQLSAALRILFFSYKTVFISVSA